MKYSDIIPKEASFTLKTIPDVEFKIRPFDLDDENWLSENYPDFESQIKKVNMKMIARTVWNQMTVDSKRHFAPVEVTIINEDGEEKKTKVGGFRLFAHNIQGVSEKMMLLKVLLQCLGLNDELIDKTMVVGDIPLSQKKSPSSSQPTGL